MRPLRSIKNQYLGVNAHLHSYWQAVGGWGRFHTNHIIPLSGDDALLFDYATLPLNFDHYNTADQRRIALRMLAIAEADKMELDLDTGQFPLSDLTLEQALARLATLIAGQNMGDTPA